MNAPALLLLSLTACNDKSVQIDGPYGEGVVWSGYNYGWDLLSHRLAMSRAVLEEDGSLTLGLIGGDWSTGESFSDTPLYRMRYQNIAAQGLVIVHGTTELTIGPEEDGTASAAVVDADLLAMSEHLVVLRGYTIDTDIPQSADYPTDYDPALGYTSRGFAFAVSAPTAAAESLDFDVTASVRWGPLDREDMNGAIPYAQTAVTVAWTAIGFEGSQTSETITGAVDYAHEPPYTAHDALTMPTTIGSGVGFAGLRSIDVSVTDQDGTDQGAYLRRFGLEIVQGDDGLPTNLTADGTNSSAFEEIPIRLEASAEVIWAELLDPAAAVEVVVLEGSHDVGEATAASP